MTPARRRRHAGKKISARSSATSRVETRRGRIIEGQAHKSRTSSSANPISSPRISHRSGTSPATQFIGFAERVMARGALWPRSATELFDGISQDPDFQRDLRTFINELLILTRSRRARSIFRLRRRFERIRAGTGHGYMRDTANRVSASHPHRRISGSAASRRRRAS